MQKRTYCNKICDKKVFKYFQTLTTWYGKLNKSKISFDHVMGETLMTNKVIMFVFILILQHHCSSKCYYTLCIIGRYHISVRNTHLFVYVINEEVPDPYQCQGKITCCFALPRLRHCDTSTNMTNEEAYNKPLQQRGRMSMQDVIPEILESRRWTCTLKIFFSAHKIQTRLRTDSLKCIQASISRYLSDGECWLIDTIVSTIETYANRTVTSVSDNSVQSMFTNNNSVQQTVIDLAPIMPNSRIALLPCSNIQRNMTINFHVTNDKNWTSDLYWKVMFNSCDKHGKLYCWPLHFIYFVVILKNKHKFFIYF
jgi:hypothetical protein